MDTFNRAFQKLSGRLNMQVTGTSETPPKPSHTKAKDLLAFRTIITMLSSIQSPNIRLAAKTAIGTTMDKNSRNALRVLDALSAVLIREHEITAVVAQPFNGLNLQVFASVVYPSNAGPLFQPGSDGAEPDSQSFWGRVFTVAINPRNPGPKALKDNSLINVTSLPIIGDHLDNVPVELVNAAKVNASVLDMFLKTHWSVFQ